MSIHRPFSWLSHSAQKRAFWIALGLTVIVLAGMNIVGGPLNTPAAPAGIISFEFAGSIGVATAMMDSWGEHGPVLAGISLGIDYLFLVAYSVAISLGCVLIAGSVYRNATVATLVGIVLAWAQFAAAAMDAVENFALIRVMLGSMTHLWPALARTCAIPKFAVVGLGLLYLIVGLVMMPILRSKRPRERVEEYRGRADTGMSTDEILSLTRQDLD